MAGFTLSLPLYVEVGVRKRKNIYFNYNRITGLHYQQRNQVKKLFTQLAVKNYKTVLSLINKLK